MPPDFLRINGPFLPAVRKHGLEGLFRQLLADAFEGFTTDCPAFRDAVRSSFEILEPTEESVY
jgi:hypothetical protein